MVTDPRRPGSLDDYRFDDASRAGALKADADAADAAGGTKKAAGEKHSRGGMAVRAFGGSSPRGPRPSLTSPSAASFGRMAVAAQAFQPKLKTGRSGKRAGKAPGAKKSRPTKSKGGKSK